MTIPDYNAIIAGLIDAGRTIEHLQRENELLQAKQEVFDVFARLLNLARPQGYVCNGSNPMYRIKHLIADLEGALEAEQEAAKTSGASE